jgi:putative SOS response-associated peptidase YedK
MLGGIRRGRETVKSMCGKFTQMMSWAKLHHLADLTASAGDGSADDELQMRTPMRSASVIQLDANGQRGTVAMRWGFADVRAKTPLERPRHMHARAETIDTLPTFANAFHHARGLALVKTFNVGEELPNGKIKQWVVAPRDGKPLALAVIYERWTDRNEGELLTFVMVTVPANPLLARVTDRMPAVIAPDHWAAWLGETPATVEELKGLLMTVDGNLDLAEQMYPRKNHTRETAQPGLF